MIQTCRLQNDLDRVQNHLVFWDGLIGMWRVGWSKKSFRKQEICINREIRARLRFESSLGGLGTMMRDFGN